MDKPQRSEKEILDEMLPLLSNMWCLDLVYLKWDQKQKWIKLQELLNEWTGADIRC